MNRLTSSAFRQRPRYFGHLTNDIIYDRLAPGIKDELRHTTPKLPSGRRKHQMHRKLMPDMGHPKLREHLASVTTIMRLSDTYEDFKHNLDKIQPRYGKRSRWTSATKVSSRPRRCRQAPQRGNVGPPLHSHMMSVQKSGGQSRAGSASGSASDFLD